MEGYLNFVSYSYLRVVVVVVAAETSVVVIALAGICTGHMKTFTSASSEGKKAAVNSINVSMYAYHIVPDIFYKFQKL